MPNCFQLTKKGEDKPTALNQVDRELCEVLGRPVSDKYYVAGWFDTIGWWVAVRDHHLGSPDLWKDLEEWCVGESYAQQKEDLTKCLKYLEENYVSNAWVQIGK